MWVKTTTALLTVAFAAGCGAPALQETAGKAVAYDKQAESELDQAVAMAARGRYTAAAVEFERLAEKYRRDEDHARAATAMFWLGFCMEKQGHIEQAREIYEHLERQYADEPGVYRSRQRLEMLSEQPETGR